MGAAKIRGSTGNSRLDRQLHRFLTEHPEVVNPAKVTRHARGLLELERLPPPPRYKLLTCRSESWQNQIKPTPTGPKVHHGDVRLADKLKELILWRRGSESTRRTRLCRPLDDLSATPPRIVQLPRRGRDVRKKKRESALAFPRNLGAGNESRTRDLNLGKVALYQLSYSRERIGILLGRRNDGQARSPLAKACGAASFR